MSDGGRIDPKWYLIAGAAVLLGLFDALGDASKNLGAASIPVWLGALGAIGWVLRGPVGHALMRAMEPAGGSGSAETEELRARVAELEGHVARMPELEERVDFAERLLAQRPEAAGLRPGDRPA